MLASPLRSSLHTVLRGAMASRPSTLPVAAVGSFAAITALDGTSIDPVAGVGASGDGFVAIVKLKGLTSLVGTIVPSALTLSVTDPGYDGSGNPTTVSRTLTGVEFLRRQYPNGGSKMISTDGTDLTLHITFDDHIYAGTSIVNAVIGSTFYPGCVASSAAARTNLSQTAYEKGLWSWLTFPNQIAGSTYAIEGTGFHRHARAGRQFACVKYNVTDGTTTSTDVLVSATALSTLQTKGSIAEVWPGTVSLSGLTQGAACFVNAKAYPWIGDSSAVLDLSTDGVAWPTARPLTRLRVINDRTGGYSGGYAYVAVGASGGTVSATPATASAAPFPSIDAAMTALRAWNNTNRGHNDLGGGTIRLKDSGSNTTHTISTSGVNAPGTASCIVEKDPASAFTISLTWSTQLLQYPDQTHWRNMTFVYASGVNYNFCGYNVAGETTYLDNIVFDNTSNKNCSTWIDNKYIRNATFIGNDCSFEANSPSSAWAIPSLVGAVGAAVSLASNNRPNVLIGNVMPFYSVTPPTTTDGYDGLIIYNNRFSQAVISNSSANTLPRGVANVQNLYEFQYGRGGVCMNFFADGDLTTITNYIEYHSAAVGARCSRMYNDAAASRVAPHGIIKRGVSKYCIWDDYNIKGDTVTSGVGGCGNWEYMYGVGNAGNVSLYGDVGSNGGYPHNDNGTTPFLGMAWLPSSNPALKNTLSDAQVMGLFTSYTVAPQGSPTIGGNYMPKRSATELKSRVPTGLSVLKYDVSGALRKTDGTGAAGAYEADTNEIFTLTISSPSANATIATGTGTVTITQSSGTLGLAAAVSLALAGNNVAGTGQFTMSASANRTSGVAPLGVQLDVTGTTAAVLTSNPFAEVYYATNWGDDTTATWSYGNKPGTAKKNISFGPVAGHVYETPGSYTAKTTAFYVSSSGVLSVGATTSTTITVGDPNTVFSGANTVCIANGTLPVAGVNGVPAGATCVNTSSLATISTYTVAGKRVLLKRGDTWQRTSNGIICAGAVGILGAYGTGAAPLLNFNTGCGNYDRAVQVNQSTGSDWRVMDLECSGASVPQATDHSQVTGLVMLEPGPFTTGLRLYSHSIGNGATSSKDDVVLCECRFEDATGGYGNVLLYSAKVNRLAVLGCNFANATQIEHCVRLQGARLVVFSNSTAAYPGTYQGTTRHCFALRGFSTGTSWDGIYSEKAVVSDCYFIGSGGLLCQFEPQNSASDERLRDIIYERNYGDPVGGGSVVATAAEANMNIRNNVFKAHSGSPIDIRAQTAPLTTPGPSSTYVYNNTAYSDTTAGFTFVSSWSLPPAVDPAGTVLKNNLVYAPSATTDGPNSHAYPTLAFYSSGVTLSGNSSDAQIKSTAPGFTVPPTTLSTWKPSASSYGDNNGVYTPVFDSLDFTSRPLACDIGAYVI